jgi:glucose-6-phosphate dehydrogenase assembly protein OpcA
MSNELKTLQGIDVEGLERELTAKWAGMSKGQSEGVHKSVTRACVLNLIVFSTPQDDAAQLKVVLDEVSQEHPCRVLVLLVDRRAEEARLDAHASTRCHVFTRGAKQLCGEQVTIEVSGPSVERAASAVEPLLVPDVPVFLWWKDIPHEEDGLFKRLAAMSDRIVLDSAASDHPHLDLLRLARMLSEAKEPIYASDINWGRLTSWRMLLASFWDVEHYWPHLERINRVAVEFHPPKVAPQEIAPQAWLVLGWLASRLGWKLETSVAKVESGVRRFNLRAADGRPIEVELRAREEAGDCGGMLKCVTLADAEGDAAFQVEYRDERTKLETRARMSGELMVGRVLAYEARSEGKRLSSELSFITRDLIYEAAVAAAASMVESVPESSNDANGSAGKLK